MLFIDIGGFKGEITRYALKEGYEVHVFEPNPNMKPYLRPLEKLAVVNYAAAWDKDGESDLHLMLNPEPGEDGVSLVGEKTNVSPDRLIKVPTINIGRYLNELDKDIDVLKINAEGAEYVIIQSILDQFDHTRIKKWLVEDHIDYMDSKEWSDLRARTLARAYSLKINLEPWINSF